MNAVYRENKCYSCINKQIMICDDDQSVKVEKTTNRKFKRHSKASKNFYNEIGKINCRFYLTIR